MKRIVIYCYNYFLYILIFLLVTCIIINTTKTYNKYYKLLTHQSFIIKY